MRMLRNLSFSHKWLSNQTYFQPLDEVSSFFTSKHHARDCAHLVMGESHDKVSDIMKISNLNAIKITTCMEEKLWHAQMENGMILLQSAQVGITVLNSRWNASLFWCSHGLEWPLHVYNFKFWCMFFRKSS